MNHRLTMATKRMIVMSKQTKKTTAPIVAKKIDEKVQRCAAQHFGPWMIDTQWFAQAVASVKAGTFKAEVPAAPTGGDCGYEIVGDGVAVVSMFGQITKEDSSFGGVNSVRTRKAVRDASDDPGVKAILLYIDSPGGTVAGTGDLALDVAAIDNAYTATNGGQGKPVYTYFEDLGASAAYWVGCQARYCFANPTAEVGSIGTMTYVEDTSGAYEKAGIKVTLIATGPLKGQWIDGNPVSDDYIKAMRTEINNLNDHFLAGVVAGRGLTTQQLEAATTGGCFIASEAVKLGLIDEVASLDAAMRAITKEISTMNADQFQTYMAEHPEAVQDVYDKGYAKAKVESMPKPATVSELRAAFPDKRHNGFVIDQLGANATMADASIAFNKVLAEELAEKDTAIAAVADEAKTALAAKDATVADLQSKLATATSGQGAASFMPSAGPVTDPKSSIPADLPTDMKAAMEFDLDPKIQAEFQSVSGDKETAKRSYVKWRTNADAGRVTSASSRVLVGA